MIRKFILWLVRKLGTRSLNFPGITLFEHNLFGFSIFVLDRPETEFPCLGFIAFDMLFEVSVTKENKLDELFNTKTEYPYLYGPVGRTHHFSDNNWW